uniref:LOV domain-containing protein n=2 Tax=Chaetoceros debilis TaxID=122233 RepID=A0A7S3V5K6_9STRA|mmetsp:Transcript_26262/g.40146  ORF Transcript_26262/g.40146 Transcript_26262/m.40146 type:complete len:429 (+) Transcript_26262:188-1474(+)|eukprot:CAMPEP_0194083962 /NCGR_PEP_ID=MMETSP0149-20130528/10872_1 /TAXON_ID=122233 /ORGANISM="Chaetoceros debilis, Strain MM31A-1" /LENGTH=428 /DNA_ID=CAMNT_0038766471 /DNA_START=190 /DNA_END=1476 /DNA_ORIENTATION=-
MSEAQPNTAPAPVAPAAADTIAPAAANGTTLASNPSTASLPMFIQSTGEDDLNGDNNLDLDDLFRDCYFGDFPMGGTDDLTAAIPMAAVSSSIAAAPVPTAAVATSISASAAAPPPAPPAPPAVAPLVSNSAFAAATTAPIVTTPCPAAPPPHPAVTTAISAAKRKAEEALGPDIVSSSSAGIHTSPGGMPSNVSTKALTDQQKVERRERNRKHAKRSRLRKKFLLESLQEQISGLQSEIESLKDIILAECPEKAEGLLESVSGPKGKFTPLPMPSGFGPVKTLMEPDFRLMSALSGSQQNFAISDPSLPDNPIVYVSQGFLQLTGYTLDQVLGRNCRFLQGPGTDQSAVDIIRKGVREGVDTSVCLLNYKADGTPFWNQFFVAALRDAENNVVNFVGVQCEVSKAVVEKQLAQKKEAEKKIGPEGGK